jgi:hypothetical protein
MKREWRARKTSGQKFRFILANIICFALEQWFRYVGSNLRRLYERLDEYRWARRISVKPRAPRRRWNDWASEEMPKQSKGLGTVFSEQDGLDKHLGTKTYAFGAMASTLILNNKPIMDGAVALYHVLIPN